MSYNIGFPSFICLTKEGIDGTTTGAVTIATTISTARFVPIFINIEPTIITGFTTVPTLSVGTNATSYNNILTASALTGAITVNFTKQFSSTALTPSVDPSTAIKVNITVGAVSTVYTLRVSVLGFYF